jgi:LmbE family N-acetylglucosaminyl deacetylase
MANEIETSQTVKDDAGPATRMVIVAHPDDPEFTCAGTVALWVKEGHQVVYVICTDGSRGSNDPGMPPEVMAPIRKAEQLEAARILGVSEVLFLDHEDGTLEHTLELRKELTRLVRRYRPDVVISGDPTRIISRNVYINHPDHRAAAEATVYAVFPSAVTRFVFPELLDEGLEPHKVQEVYLYAPPEGNHWVDVSDTIDLKIAALKAHRSQVAPDYVDERIREWNGELGRLHGVAYAEEFRKIVLR